MNKDFYMAIKPILIMGELSLLEKSTPVTHFDTEELHNIIQDLIDTFRNDNGIGLSAPQIGINQRIVVFEFHGHPRYPSAPPIPLTVLINPEITPLTEEKVEMWEGCFSVPGLRGKVARYKKIKYSAYDQFGKKFERVAEDMHARIVQHECDHLDGILYPALITDLKNFGYQDVVMPRILQDIAQR